jgi:AcrR family transcriptional regulator
MAQVLKDKARSRVKDAAIRAFAESGFLGATMETIAQKAGMSVGNLYRYFKDKRSLFSALLPDSFANKLIKLLEEKIIDAAGKPVGDGEAFHDRNRELIAMLIENRDEIIILLRGSAGTNLERFYELLIDSLVSVAEGYRRTLEQTDVPPWPVRSVVIKSIYRSLVNNIVEAIAFNSDEESIAEALHAIFDYHFFGVGELLAPKNR